MSSTLGTLVNNCAVDLGDADDDGAAVFNYYTEFEYKKAISEAYQHYSMLMIDEGEGWFEVSTYLGFTALDEEVDLSALTPPFFSVASLERVVTNGTVPLRESQRRFVPNFTVNTGTGDAYQPTYREQGNTLILEPQPQTTETGSSTSGLKLRYNYMPTFPTGSSADSFTFDSVFPLFFEPMVQLYADIVLLESKDAVGGISDINSFRGRLAKLEEAFMESLERTEYPDSVQYIGLNYSNNTNYNR